MTRLLKWWKEHIDWLDNLEVPENISEETIKELEKLERIREVIRIDDSDEIVNYEPYLEIIKILEE